MVALLGFRMAGIWVDVDLRILLRRSDLILLEPKWLLGFSSRCDTREFCSDLIRHGCNIAAC
jgi:hypothetical protein